LDQDRKRKGQSERGKKREKERGTKRDREKEKGGREGVI
jgi:hypothetical protein